MTQPEKINSNDLIAKAIDLRNARSDYNPAYDLALVELLSDVLGYSEDDRDFVTRIVQGKQRQFEARGKITIEYAMGFNEAEAREWFPDAQWDDEGASQAGAMEDIVHTGPVPQDFWACMHTKRDVVISVEVGPTSGPLDVDEITGVVEL